jgi:cell division initiation protein
VTEQPKHDFPYYRSPEAIRSEEFSHRMRGLDEQEVRDYLDVLASQVEASERDRREDAAEIERLRAEVERRRAEAEELRQAPREPEQGEISPQAVALFSEAQQVADQLVEEAVLHARDLMSSARLQQREILEEARRAAETLADGLMDGAGESLPSAVGAATEYATPVPEIEYVRTFARIAQVQLRSVINALAEQVDKLGNVPDLQEIGPGRRGERGATPVLPEQHRRINLLPPNAP